MCSQTSPAVTSSHRWWPCFLLPGGLQKVRRSLFVSDFSSKAFVILFYVFLLVLFRISKCRYHLLLIPSKLKNVLNTQIFLPHTRKYSKCLMNAISSNFLYALPGDKTVVWILIFSGCDIINILPTICFKFYSWLPKLLWCKTEHIVMNSGSEVNLWWLFWKYDHKHTVNNTNELDELLTSEWF